MKSALSLGSSEQRKFECVLTFVSDVSKAKQTQKPHFLKSIKLVLFSKSVHE